jgi:hypothetical protein
VHLIFCSLAGQKWQVWFHFNGRNPVKRGIYEKDISFSTLLSLIGSGGYGESDYMYYLKDEQMGIEGVQYLCNDDSVQDMMKLFHHVKVLNIKVVRGTDHLSISAQPDDNYINTQHSCTINMMDDRKAQLEKSRLQREADLRHFEGDTDVSEFVSEDGGDSDKSAEAIDMDVQFADAEVSERSNHDEGEERSYHDEVKKCEKTWSNKLMSS